jgi:prophage maintenance system killer protein
LPARDVHRAAGSFLTGFTFLYENGYAIVADEAEVVAAMLSLADHTLDEAGYAAWLREHVAHNQ